MKRLIWIPIIALALSTLACSVNFGGVGFRTVKGSGVIVSEERKVSDFSKISLSGFGNLYLEVGDEEALVIEAEDNFLEHIKTEVRGQTLEIKYSDYVSLQPTESINYYLTVKELDDISISGLGKVEIPELQTSSLRVDISGGGDININNLEADTLIISISGLGKLDIAGGEVAEQRINISGGGDYTADELTSLNATVDISGLGNAMVSVEDTLRVTISGGGSVKYIGNPEVTSDISGLGNINQIKE
jgi:hypothetical protein